MKCKYCLQDKPIAEFCRQKGWENSCKLCRSQILESHASACRQYGLQTIEEIEHKRMKNDPLNTL